MSTWHALGGAESVMPAVAEPELASRTAPALGEPAGDWLCAWCLNPVANDKDRFRYEGKDEFTFSNPDGLRFAIITFSRTLGCRQTGVPTLEHTWFPGHAWSYCQCERCGVHLGWCYAGQPSFAGLIKDRIVRAICVRNEAGRFRTPAARVEGPGNAQRLPLAPWMSDYLCTCVLGPSFPLFAPVHFFGLSWCCRRRANGTLSRHGLSNS